jgi:hypothetical protein
MISKNWKLNLSKHIMYIEEQQSIVIFKVSDMLYHVFVISISPSMTKNVVQHLHMCSQLCDIIMWNNLIAIQSYTLHKWKNVRMEKFVLTANIDSTLTHGQINNDIKELYSLSRCEQIHNDIKKLYSLSRCEQINNDIKKLYSLSRCEQINNYIKKLYFCRGVNK